MIKLNKTITKGLEYMFNVTDANGEAIRTMCVTRDSVYSDWNIYVYNDLEAKDRVFRENRVKNLQINPRTNEVVFTLYNQSNKVLWDMLNVEFIATIDKGSVGISKDFCNPEALKD